MVSALSISLREIYETIRYASYVIMDSLFYYIILYYSIVYFIIRMYEYFIVTIPTSNHSKYSRVRRNYKTINIVLYSYYKPFSKTIKNYIFLFHILGTPKLTNTP